MHLEDQHVLLAYEAGAEVELSRLVAVGALFRRAVRENQMLLRAFF